MIIKFVSCRECLFCVSSLVEVNRFDDVKRAFNCEMRVAMDIFQI